MLTFLFASAVLALFLVVPGMLLVIIARWSPILALPLGGAVSGGILALLGQLFYLLGVPWRLPTVLAGWIIILGGALALRILSYRFSASPRHASQVLSNTVEVPSRVQVGRFAATNARQGQALYPGFSQLKPGFFGLCLAISWLFSAAVQLRPLLRTLPSFASPSQSYDAMFHYSGVQAIANSGAAPWRGSLDLLYPGGVGVYYPAQWHQILALFRPFASVTLLSNALAVAVIGVLYPLSVLVVSQFLFGSRCWSGPLAIALSPLVLLYPYHVGVLQALYPNVLSVCWWPPLLVLTWRLALFVSHRCAPARSALFLPARLLTVGTIVLIGAVHAHPSTGGLFALAGFVALVNALLRKDIPAWWSALAAVFFLAAIWAVPWAMHRLGMSARAGQAGDSLSLPRALGSVFALATVFQEPWWTLVPLGLLAVTGMVFFACKHRDWLVVGFSLAVALLVSATKIPLGPLSTLTALWYGAYDRIGASLAALVPVLAAGVIGLIVGAGNRVWSLCAQRLLGLGTLMGAVLLACCLGAGTGVQKDRYLLAQISFAPGSQFHPAWVSTKEFEALSSLKLPPGSVVIGDPSAGAGLIFAASGIPNYYLQLSASAYSPEQKYLAQHFRQIHTDATVCQIVRKSGITHYFADATGVSKKDYHFPGLHQVDTNRGFTLVATADQARIYRIDACH